MSVEGGNWKIFHEMITASGAKLNLNTTVTEIEKVTHGSKTAWKVVSEREIGYFDSVVVASPMVPALAQLTVASLEYNDVSGASRSAEGDVYDVTCHPACNARQTQSRGI